MERSEIGTLRRRLQRYVDEHDHQADLETLRERVADDATSAEIVEVQA